MRLNVQLFAVLRQRAGRERIEVELPEGASVADLLAELTELIGALPVRVAVNREYAESERGLSPGDELALIPPVSGGSDVHAAVRSEPLSVDRLCRLVGRPGAGAIVSFQGVTREVERLEYEAYAEMAERRMAEIAAECLERHGLEAIAVEHRRGSVPLGEAAVIVAASAAHRPEAFAGAREAIDRIKAEAPIWKREVVGEEERWVEGTRPA
jgi:MoaE-MoaD fusion protein